MCDEGWVGVVADDDSADSLGAAVSVESVVLLLDVLTLAWAGALSDCFGEKAQKFADTVIPVSSLLLLYLVP